VKRFFACLFFCLFPLNGLLAQDPTTAESVHREQVYDRYKIEQRIQQAVTEQSGVQIKSPQKPPISPDGKSQSKIFKLNNVVFEPMPVAVSMNELEAIVTKYKSMDAVSIYDLYVMISEIDALYDTRNILGRAGLPVQDVEGGSITVEIIEGRISKTDLTVKSPPVLPLHSRLNETHRLFSQKFVNKQFRFQGKQSVNLKQLENELLRYNRTFRSQLAAELAAGDEPGTTTLKLTQVLPNPVSGGYYVDNSGRESSGKIRNGMYLNFVDLLGADESVFVSYDETEGTSALYLSGDLPINACGTFFDMSYYYGTPQTINGPFAVLNIHGTSEQMRPGFRQILVNKPNSRLDMVFHTEYYESETFFDTALNYGEKHTLFDTGFEWTHRGKKSTLITGFNAIAGNAGILDNYTNSYSYKDFALIKANLMKIWYPNKKLTFIARVSGSASLTDIPQSQQFQIGGQATVRGHDEGLLNGDSGILLTAEARYNFWNSVGRANSADSQHSLHSRNVDECSLCAPIFSKRNLQREFCEGSRADIFLFFDNGGVFYRIHPADSGSYDNLASIGTGTLLTLGKHFSATLGYGQPIFTDGAGEQYRSTMRHGNFFMNVRATF
jgi:hemolysin activation/secretion protein